MSNNSILSATKWSAITNILSKITPPIANIFLARLLTPEAFGVVATINLVITFADIFTDAGFQKYLIQHEFEDEDHLFKSTNVAFWSNFTLSIISWLIIFIFRNNLAKLVGSEGYGIHLTIAAFSIPLLSFSSIQQALYKRNYNFKGLFIPKLIRSIVPLVITVPLACYFHNCWALIIGTLAAHVSDAILLTVKSKWKPSFYYSLIEFREMFSFSFWTLLETIAIWLTGNIDVFIIGKNLNQYYLGIYKTALLTVSQITSIIVTTIIPVLFTSLSRNQKDDEQFKMIFSSFQNKCAIILVPLSFGIFIYRSLVTKILLGSQWNDATLFIGLIGLLQFVLILIYYFASEVYRSKGNPKVSFIVQVIDIVVSGVIIFIASSKSFELLCYAKIITLLLFALMHIIVLATIFHFNILKLSKNFVVPLICSVVMSIVAHFLLMWHSEIYWQFIEIFICIVIYFTLYMCFPKERKEVLLIINKYILRK
ncbi:MAG: oligosaccharide flippase family protein [Treponema sp.]|nr:oligosaccharide flippase family protein [Treponema sp.]